MSKQRHLSINAIVDSSVPYLSRTQHHNSLWKLKLCLKTRRDPSTPLEALASVRLTQRAALERDKLSLR